MGSPEPICRICGATDGESFIEIFSAEGERNYLEHKLNYCFTKEVSVTIYSTLLENESQA